MLRIITTAVLATTSLMAQVVYIPNAMEGTLSTFVYDQEGGAVTEILPRTQAGGSPVSVAIHPTGKFALVASGGGGGNLPNLASYLIDASSGKLSLAGRSPLVQGSNPQAVAIDSGGKFAFVAHQAVVNGASTLASFAIDPSSGTLTPVAGSPFSTPAGLTSVAVHPNGKFVYVGAATAGQVAAYTIGANGALAAIEGSPFAARTMIPGMAMDREGKFLFAAEREGRGVLAYAVNASTGALTPVAGSPFSTGSFFPTNVGVSVDGRFLYVSSGGGVISTFAISPAGALTQRPNTPALLGLNSVILDPGGKFLFAGSNQSNLMSTYSIDSSTGALTEGGRPVSTGAGPRSGAALVLDPPILPPIELSGVVNQASQSAYGAANAGIAQGSLMGIAGMNIGPAEPADNPQGISVEIRSGDTVTPAIVVYATGNEVRAVAPSSTPMGEARLTLTYKGRTTNAVPLKVVAVSPGVRSNTHTGYGPAAAWNVPPGTPLTLDVSVLTQIRNRIATPARPGQTMVLGVTGLGAVDADETTEFVQEIGTEVEVVVGHKTATVLAKARTSGGMDYITFRLPEDVPTGCYVPILVRAAGVQSNVPSISISTDGGPCFDPAGFSASDIEMSERTDALSVGVIQLNRLDFVGDEVSEIGARFVRYTRQDFRNSFAAATADIGVRSGFSVPPLGTCTVTPVIRPEEDLDLEPDRTPVVSISAGPALNVSTPGGNLQLGAPNYHFSSETRQFEPGDYTVDNGAGAEPVGRWRATITLPPQVQWTNRTALTTVNRREDLVITWSGGLADKEIVIVAGLSQGNDVSAAFACTERVTAGRLTIPSWVFANLPASGEFTDGGMSFPNGVLGLFTVPLSSVGRFTAPGLGFGLFTYEQGGFIFMPFR